MFHWVSIYLNFTGFEPLIILKLLLSTEGLTLSETERNIFTGFIQTILRIFPKHAKPNYQMSTTMKYNFVRILRTHNNKKKHYCECHSKMIFDRLFMLL